MLDGKQFVVLQIVLDLRYATKTLVFMHDNDPKHASKFIQNWLNISMLKSSMW